jgi:hypothetical protein
MDAYTGPGDNDRLNVPPKYKVYIQYIILKTSVSTTLRQISSSYTSQNEL